MFEWFYRFLYSITKALFACCDKLMKVAFKLAGIESVTYKGEDIDFITFLIQNDQVQFAFAMIVILAFVLLMMFTVIAILKSIAKRGESNAMTPGQIVTKAFNSVLMFLFVPAAFLTLTLIVNKFMFAIYRATSNGAPSIGAYLFSVFASDTGCDELVMKRFLLTESDPSYLDYYSTGTVFDMCGDMTEFNYFMSWIVGGVVFYYLSASLIQFVSRAIDIVILFIAAPMSIASSILDEGARYKTWRDQVISKYLGAFGTIIGINIYCMLAAAVASSDFRFVENSALNNISKILIIAGGAFTMRKSMALISTLVSQTAGADQRDPAFQGNALASAAAATGKALYHVPGVHAIAEGVKNTVGNKIDSLKEGIQKKLGLDTKRNKPGESGGGGGSKSNDSEDSDNKNEEKPEQTENDDLKKALENGEPDDNAESNENNEKSENKGNEMVNNAINNGESQDDKDKGKGEDQ